MKNQSKLILANLFALVSVLVILTVSQLLNVNLAMGSGAVFPQMLLLVVPQLGFGYLLWKSFHAERAKALS
ncbi:hypothetical protein [Cyclobacterium plantarum]|uniref:Uncharacterized protein n=1 Tax=Cyclobacterium plantarum TaxID=2716263 RepID=A0ABX0H5V5_9BACT|nr:hypothetical protein [Cyclobacterium plantarum]NHE55743.1 hypothetical protein [Cyclobacterium plantarum]